MDWGRKSYSFEKILGRGSFGKVFLVIHRQTNEKYALKHLNLTGLLDRDSAMVEVSAMSKLNHERIVRLKTYFHDEENLYILSEHCEGGDLNKFLEHQKQCSQNLPEALIRVWISQLTGALEHIHSRNIIHRDIKPHNIFLGNQMTAKLGDLGIAKIIETLKTMRADSFQGTLSYMAPEMFDSTQYNQKVDVWGLGCCFYEMVTLQPVFGGKTYTSLVNSIKYEELPEIKSRKYSLQLKSLVKSILQREPSRRPTASSILESVLIRDVPTIVPQAIVRLFAKKEDAIDSHSVPSQSSVSDADSTVIANHSTELSNNCSSTSSSKTICEKDIALQIDEAERCEESALINGALKNLELFDTDTKSATVIERTLLSNSVGVHRQAGKSVTEINGETKSELKKNKSFQGYELSNGQGQVSDFSVDDCLNNLRAKLTPFEMNTGASKATDQINAQTTPELSLSGTLSDELNSSSETKKEPSRRKRKKSLLNSLRVKSTDGSNAPIEETSKEHSKQENISPENPVTLYTRGQFAEYSTRANKEVDHHKFSMKAPVYQLNPVMLKSTPVQSNSHQNCVSGPALKNMQKELEESLGRDMVKKCLLVLKEYLSHDHGMAQTVLQELVGLPKYTIHADDLFFLAGLQTDQDQ
ncbi:hypothetical protein ScPMuIL_007411 [Solemya velum]